MPYREITTDAGVLRGFDDGQVTSLLGARYGQSTEGAGRFRAPVAVARWDGVQDAVTFGPTAPQVDTRLHAAANGPAMLRLLYPRGGSPAEGGPISEDCLRVNVWAPSNAEPGSLPVIVWLHGGGFVHGSGNEMAFNGDVLAGTGEAVVVTVTHRLGLLGFLDLREHGYPDSVNAGMLDIVLALDWVKRNIAAVGGDPRRVTIAGQSGGSAKVATLHGMPAAQDLFARAIMMSGPGSMVLTAEQTQAMRDRVLETAGIDADDLATADLARVLEIQDAAMQAGTLDLSSADFSAILGFSPALDENHLPQHPFADGSVEWLTDRQMMIGWTEHELGLLLVDDPSFTVRMTGAEVVSRIEAMAPGSGDKSFADLSSAHPEEPPHLIWSRLLSTRVFIEPARELADRLSSRAESVWAYQFEQRTDVLDGLLGSCHSLDLAFAFGTVDRIPLTGTNPARRETSAEIMRAWLSFARDGKPQGTDSTWSPWTAGSGVPYRYLHRQ